MSGHCILVGLLHVVPLHTTNAHICVYNTPVVSSTWRFPVITQQEWSWLRLRVHGQHFSEADSCCGHLRGGKAIKHNFTSPNITPIKHAECQSWAVTVRSALHPTDLVSRRSTLFPFMKQAEDSVDIVRWEIRGSEGLSFPQQTQMGLLVKPRS